MRFENRAPQTQWKPENRTDNLGQNAIANHLISCVYDNWE